MALEDDSKDNAHSAEDMKTKPTALGGMIDIFRANIGDTIAYTIMAVGLILCFFEPFVGSLPVGFVMGLYFSTYIFEYVHLFKNFLINEGIFKGFIIIATLFALAICAPGLLLGSLIGSVARPLFGSTISASQKGDNDTEEK